MNTKEFDFPTDTKETQVSINYELNPTEMMREALEAQLKASPVRHLAKVLGKAIETLGSLESQRMQQKHEVFQEALYMCHSQAEKTYRSRRFIRGLTLGATTFSDARRSAAEGHVAMDRMLENYEEMDRSSADQLAELKLFLMGALALMSGPGAASPPGSQTQSLPRESSNPLLELLGGNGKQKVTGFGSSAESVGGSG